MIGANKGKSRLGGGNSVEITTWRPKTDPYHVNCCPEHGVTPSQRWNLGMVKMTKNVIVL